MARLLITAVCAAGAVCASFIFISTLGTLTGWPGRSALLLPLSVDALAAAAWLTYWSGEGDARRFAGRVGASATIASMIGNGLSHLLVAGWGGWAWALLVAAVGSVPAVSLALVVRLSVPNLYAERPANQTVGATEVSSANLKSIAPEPVTSAPVQAGGRPRATQPDAVLLGALPDGIRPTATAIRAALRDQGYRIGPTRAGELRDLITASSPTVGHVNGQAVTR